MMALAKHPNGLTSEELDDLIGLKAERVDALIDTLGGHNMSQAEIDAGKWLHAAVNFSDVLGGEGDTCGDAAVDEPLYLNALIEFQLGEPPASTPTEMFPHLLRSATSLFFNAIEADLSCQTSGRRSGGSRCSTVCCHHHRCVANTVGSTRTGGPVRGSRGHRARRRRTQRERRADRPRRPHPDEAHRMPGRRKTDQAPPWASVR